MFQPARIKELDARRRLLVAESEVNRRLLVLELARLRPVAEQAQEAVSFGRKLSPLLAMGAAALGGFLIIKGNSLRGITAKALAGWQLFKVIKPLWDKLRTLQSDSDNLDQLDGEPVGTPYVADAPRR